MREKRQHLRTPVRFKVVCAQEGAADFEAEAKDLSMGGMFIDSSTMPAFGASVTIVVEGMAPRVVRLPATVRWTMPEGFGVQFGLLGAYETHALVNFMKKQKP